MPEDDTIHRDGAADADGARPGSEIELADAPNPRSPIHNRRRPTCRARESSSARRRSASIFVAHFSGGIGLHSHLGMNGRWWITADGRLPYGKPWLRLASGRSVASQTGGKVLRIVQRVKGCAMIPALRRLGPDPLRAGFDLESRRRAASPMAGAGREIGDALLDQNLIAGIGNAIRNEALFSRRGPARGGRSTIFRRGRARS